jgi:2,4-dienoyl-CoA reductase-like NADH-dependent reductase (Old Yellow Enzyme family)
MNTLFSPLKIRDLTIKNRIVVSPMQQYSSPEGIVNDWHLVHLGSRAVGGAGLIITESTAVSPEGRSTINDSGIWNDEQAMAWQKIIHFIHTHNTKIAIQLGHFGSKGSRSHPKEGLKYMSPEQGGWQTVSSSANAPFNGMSIPKALEINEIQEIQQKYVAAALRAVRAGFDAIEIHAAHGYLFHQFYSEMINQRNDNYGGSFENRIRFLIETVQAIRKVIPENIPLLVRISAVDYLEDAKAWQLEDSVLLTKILKENRVDLITASAGGFVFLDKSKVFPSYQVPFATKIKNETGILTGAVGMITEAKQANEIIAQNQADVVVIAREFLRNPYFAIQASQELNEKIEIPWQYSRAY